MPRQTKKKRWKIPALNPLLSPMLLLLLCFGLVINLITPAREFSQTENRPLAGFPGINVPAIMDGTWCRGLDDWFSDQFTGRNLYFHLNYLVRKFSGQRMINDVFLGKGALLGQPEKADMSIVNGNINTINTFAAQSGLPLAVLVAPSASQIQNQKLPALAPVRNENTALDAIYKNLKQPALSADIRSLFTDRKKEDLYYKTDHHWTSYGAGLAFTQLVQVFGLEVNLNSYSPLLVSSSFEGTLASRTGSVFLKDQIYIYSPSSNPDYIVTWADGTKTTSIYDLDALNQKDQYELFLGKNQSIVRIETTNNTGRNLLIFKDSYANSMIQFLLPCYQSITIIDPRYYYDNVTLLLSLYSITEVACIFSYDTFVTDSSLQDVLNTYTQEQTQQSQEEEPAA